MLMTKLPWAGIRLAASDGSAVAIDPLFHPPAMFGAPREPMRPLDAFGPVDAVLITHLHGDHFDPQAIAAFYGADIPVYVPEPGAGESVELAD